MTKTSAISTRRAIVRYDWNPVIDEYMTNLRVRVMDDVVVKTVKVDKAAECVYAQLIAEAWGLC